MTNYREIENRYWVGDAVCCKEKLRASCRAITMQNMLVLSEKSRLGQKVVVRRTRRRRNNLSRGLRWRNRKRSRETSYGRVLYNYFRTYDPSTGRYLESDPIGLYGGLNTYGYAFQNPLQYSDPKGLNPAAAAVCFVPGIGWVGCGTAALVGGLALGTAYVVGQVMANSSGDDNVIPFPDTKADEGEQCDTDDIDPCEELLAALQVRLIQLLGRATQGIDVTFEVRQYQAALREFMLLCPELSGRAPKIPPGL